MRQTINISRLCDGRAVFASAVELTDKHAAQAPKCLEPSFQKPSFRLRTSEGERPFVGVAGLLRLSQSTAEFGAGRMSQVVFVNSPRFKMASIR